MAGSFCLTLGHNASAVYIDDDFIVGYEEERLSKKKSDSSFPDLAIQEIYRRVGVSPDDIENVYISHWFDHHDVSATENKYYSAARMKTYFPNATFTQTSGHEFSHHDAHALSVQLFNSYHNQTEHNLVLVVDGFGNNQEVASLYKTELDGSLKRIDRIYGYEHSLGLMYQYAAEACGMDGINDVYKFLGYRTQGMTDDEMLRCHSLIDVMVGDFINVWLADDLARDMPKDNFELTDEVIDLPALMETKRQFINAFSYLVDDDEQFQSRVRVGYAVQEILERVVVAYVRKKLENLNYEADNLLVAGGCFYNVRLNDKLRKALPSHMHFTPMPLAGDQGAGLGVAAFYDDVNPGIFRNLYWGMRDTVGHTTAERISSAEAVRTIPKLIADGMIVNVFHGDHEFGPRALCNTSTLAKPDKKLVEAINTANGRTTVMPMAPAMLESAAMKMFGDSILWKSRGSDEFMITAWNFEDADWAADNVAGAAHRDVDGSYSGRPQIVDPTQNAVVADILEELFTQYDIPCVINTSLNIHGQPIVYDLEDLEKVQTDWTQHCPLPFRTFIIED